jgi:hypothetical protein
MPDNSANGFDLHAPPSLPEVPIQRSASRAVKDSSNQTTFSCSAKGCTAKPFKRRAELQRHELKHKPDRQAYPCTAVGCNRIGARAFYREDKLKDHMLAGHDENTLFACSSAANRLCKIVLPRDVMGIHSWPNSLNNFRVCPIPRCSFRVYTRWKTSPLDDLQNHLRAKHDAKGRANCSDLISAKGYLPATVDVVCPMCCEQATFRTHVEFYRHFSKYHFHGPAEIEDIDFNDQWEFKLQLRRCTFVPDEVRQHRRTILSLCPAFDAYPVWEDVKSGH